ncbi:unnamed protein product [Durusdinium trenchii]|uniref:Protein of centriole 5 n=1 Tax=Durusdinium trenchii TaxID=1381693 RepID=A0ABP0NTS5_9DINO
MRSWYPAPPQADLSAWAKGPIFKGDAKAVEELFSVPWNRAPTPTPVITRPVEVATIAPQLRSSPSAPLLNAASPGVPGPAFQFAQMPRDRPSSPQVQAPFLRGLSAAPQQCVFTQMPGPCRQRSAPVLLGAQQAPAVASASSGSAQVQQQYKDVSIRPPATPDRGSQTPVAVVRTTTPRSLHVQAQMPMRRQGEADGGLKPPPPGVTAPFATPDGISACSALPCRQQSAPILVAPPQVTVVTTTLPSSHASQPAPIPQGPWMSEQKSEEKKAEVSSLVHKLLQVKFSKGKDELADLLARQRRRRVLTGSCLAAWAAQWRASNRALLTTSSEQCRKLQEEVNQKSAAAQRAEAELTRRTEDEFRRLREVQTELSQLQQEAPALQARPQAQKVPSVPAFLVARAEKTLAHLCLIAWRREVHSRQSVCKVLQPTWAAEARHLLRRTWVLWRPLGRLQRQKATLSKLASANIEREASAFLRRVLVAWREKVALSHSGSASKGDHASVGTVPLLGGPEAVLRPNNKVRDGREQQSPASTQPLDVPKEVTNGVLREGDSTPPPPPPPRRRSMPGVEKKPDVLTAEERLQEAAKMVEIQSPVLPVARPGGVQWRAAVWPITGNSGRTGLQRPGQRDHLAGDKMILRCGPSKV